MADFFGAAASLTLTRSRGPLQHVRTLFIHLSFNALGNRVEKINTYFE